MRIEKRFRAQGIRDAERPMGLKERFGLRSMSFDPTSRFRSTSFEEQAGGQAGVRCQTVKD